LVLKADGTYTYQLDNSLPAVNGLKTGQSLSESFNYSVVDTDGSVSAAKLVITIDGHTDAPPVVQTPVSASAPDHVLVEGSSASGQFTVTAEAGIDSVSLVSGAASLTLTLAQLQTLSPAAPLTLSTDKGTLTLTGFDVATGSVSYAYTAKTLDHVAGAPLDDLITVTVKDATGVSSQDGLLMQITDTAPQAKADSNAVSEDGVSTATGNVLANDQLGKDGNALDIVAGAGTIQGKYGVLKLQADGSYTYELDNTNPAVNKLDDGQSLEEKFSYTVADKDGSLSTADLVITINGYTDGKPQVVTSHVLGDDDTVQNSITSCSAVAYTTIGATEQEGWIR
jgi:VCBS repeat-containing protein